MKMNFHGYTISEAARLTGVPQPIVWRHAHGQAITTKFAIIYHVRLGIPITELLPELKPFVLDKTKLTKSRPKRNENATQGI